MKRKLLNTSMIYFGLAIAAGVFYREFTKMSGYSGETMLRFVHAHLFVLGMALFLVIALFCNQERSLMEDKTFKQFFKLYNISLPFMACMMLVRGVLQVQGAELSRGADAAISGVAGISHILLTVSLALLFKALKKN
ncbi:hypothetical protein C818_02072 [Lachnospiraceae bacterium MD308]|nr:hypothetical protein C818_02072 [Lachnospiraceae bacterium MD308]